MFHYLSMGGFALPSMTHFLPQDRIAKECSCLLWHSRLNFLDPLQSECKIFFHRNFLLTAKFITMDTHGTSEYTIAYNKNSQFDATTSEYANEKELFRRCRKYATLCDPISCLGRPTTFRRNKLCKGPTLQSCGLQSCGVGAGAANTARKKLTHIFPEYR